MAVQLSTIYDTLDCNSETVSSTSPLCRGKFHTALYTRHGRSVYFVRELYKRPVKHSQFVESDRDHMVVGFTTTYAISAYHHWCCEFESRSARGVQHYVIKFVGDLQQIGGFLRVIRFPPPIKTDRHDITQILLKVAVNTIKKNKKNTAIYQYTNPRIDNNFHKWLVLDSHNT